MEEPNEPTTTNQNNSSSVLPALGLRECLKQCIFLDAIGLNYKAILLTALDIARHMERLHSSGAVHGHLKACNVLLKCGGKDSRGVFATVIGANPALFQYGTAIRDQHDFGTLLVDLFTGGDTEASASQMDNSLLLVGDSNISRCDFTPHPVLPPVMPPGYQQLVQQCWQEDPPGFGALVHDVEALVEDCRARCRAVSLPTVAGVGFSSTPADFHERPGWAAMAGFSSLPSTSDRNRSSLRCASLSAPSIQGPPAWQAASLLRVPSRHEQRVTGPNLVPRRRSSAPSTTMSRRPLAQQKQQLLPIEEGADEGTLLAPAPEDGQAGPLLVPEFFRRSEPCMSHPDMATTTSPPASGPLQAASDDDFSSSTTKLAKLLLTRFKRAMFRQ